MRAWKMRDLAARKKVHAILLGEARVRHATLRASFHRTCPLSPPTTPFPTRYPTWSNVSLNVYVTWVGIEVDEERLSKSFLFFFFKRDGRLFEESRKIDGEELFRSENGKSSQFSFVYKYMVIIKFFQAPFLNSKKLMVDESVITTIISIKLITSRD